MKKLAPVDSASRLSICINAAVLAGDWRDGGTRKCYKVSLGAEHRMFGLLPGFVLSRRITPARAKPAGAGGQIWLQSAGPSKRYQLSCLGLPVMKIVLKCIALLVIFAVLFVLPAIVLPLQVTAPPPTPADGIALLTLLIVDVAAVVYLVLRLNLFGFRLFAAVVLVFWGLQTFMTQIETWYFADAMPAISATEMRNLFLRPLITVVCFVPIAMGMFARWRTRQEVPSPVQRVHLGRIAILSVAYVAIYFVFGYYVAWQFEEVRMFYTGTGGQNDFAEQLRSTVEERPLILPFQVFRGFLWILCGLPLVLYLKGTRTEKILACMLMYGVLTTVQLLLTNPFMPEAVRIAHLLEVGSSNLLFGFLIGYFLARPRNAWMGGLETTFNQQH